MQATPLGATESSSNRTSASAAAAPLASSTAAAAAISLSSSGLLARRRSRSRNSNSASSSLSYDLPPLSIPQPCGCHCRRRDIAAKSETIRHVQLVERDASEIVASCLRLLVMSRLDPEHTAQADAMMREAGNDVEIQSDAVAAAATAAAASQAPGVPVDSSACAGHCDNNGGCSTGGGGGGGGGTCRDNERLARQLAGFADEFCRSSRRGQLAVDCARRMDLPPRLSRDDFDAQLTELLVGVRSVRSKVAVLLLACAELATRAVIVCHRVALTTILAWCQELFCSIASSLVVLQGWGCVIKEDTAVTTLGPIALVLTLLLIGCTIGRWLRSRCH